MKQIIFALTIVLIVSCGQSSDTNKTNEQNTTTSEEQKDTASADIALKFINLYVENWGLVQKPLRIDEWVNSNNMSTNNFKVEFKKIIEEAEKENPGIGLYADPIFDAQDYPEEGFELESFDNQTNFVVVRGKNWADFKLTMKIVLENGNWLVDGCGIINIPDDKRSAR